MLYSELVKVYQDLEKTSKRLEKTAITSDFIKHVPENQLKNVIYLLEGRVFPEWDERKIGFSTRLMIKALSIVSGKSGKEIESLWSKKGDLGIVAETVLEKKTQATLTKRRLDVNEVITNIRKLSELEGEGMVAKKLSYVTELLFHSNAIEAKYIVKIILEELRVGTASGIMRDSIAKAFDKDAKDIEKCADLLIDYGEVALLAKENKLKNISLKPGRPLKLMLASLAENMEEAFEYLGKTVQIEEKLDGFRLEIHKNNDEIKLFTRNFEDVTKQFPDVVESVKKNVKGKSFIIDCEAVGFNIKTGKYMPFQSISQRIKRKYDIEKIIKELPIELNVFDLIFYNDRNLMNETLRERRILLEKIIKQIPGKIILTKKIITDSCEKAEEFYKKCLNEGLEGVMIKNLESVYRPGRYVNGWMKLKNILEPIDAVIIKAEYGQGKRARWLSSYTIACQDKGKFLEVGKVSTGVKEKTEGLTYKKLTDLLKPLIIEQKGREVTVKPKIIIEVGYEEIQKSPGYSSGFALRFPKVHLLRSVDKPLSEITDLKTVEKIYKMQRGKGTNKNK